MITVPCTPPEQGECLAKQTPIRHQRELETQRLRYPNQCPTEQGQPVIQPSRQHHAKAGPEAVATGSGIFWIPMLARPPSGIRNKPQERHAPVQVRHKLRKPFKATTETSERCCSGEKPKSRITNQADVKIHQLPIGSHHHHDYTQSSGFGVLIESCCDSNSLINHGYQHEPRTCGSRRRYVV